MEPGFVKWFNSQKGYGFITSDKDKKDYFAHFSSIKAEGYKKLNTGDKVTFDIGNGPKGPQANNIQVTQPAGSNA
jgi:CspA family cold shock protein